MRLGLAGVSAAAAKRRKPRDSSKGSAIQAVELRRKWRRLREGFIGDKGEGLGGVLGRGYGVWFRERVLLGGKAFCIGLLRNWTGASACSEEKNAAVSEGPCPEARPRNRTEHTEGQATPRVVEVHWKGRPYRPVGFAQSMSTGEHAKSRPHLPKKFLKRVSLASPLFSTRVREAPLLTEKP